MNIIDIILSIFLLLGVVRGFFKGFFVELAGLVALIGGIYGALHFSDRIYHLLNIFITWKEKYLSILAFAFTFILIVIIISMAGQALTKVAGVLALGLVNRLLGAIFGLLKTAFIASVIIMFFHATDEDIEVVDEETLENSILYGPVRAIAPSILPSILRKAWEHDLLDEDTETAVY